MQVCYLFVKKKRGHEAAEVQRHCGSIFHRHFLFIFWFFSKKKFFSSHLIPLDSFQGPSGTRPLGGSKIVSKTQLSSGPLMRGLRVGTPYKKDRMTAKGEGGEKTAAERI